ncbi:MAG: TRAP transporter fused permease subunit [Rhizobiales bacterium]|nr:TRAP transporter fused permease subunit [Hyphomicrobiales bacterium]
MCLSPAIPAMKRMGYRPAFAGAVEAAASTGGILMPPVMGAAAFLMADILGVSYWTIALSAAIPGVLYYIAMFTIVDFEGGRTGLAGIPAAEIPPLRKTLSNGWFLIAAIVVLLVLMGYLGHPVDQSALIATVVLVVLAFVPTGRLRFSGLLEALDDGGRLLAEIGAAGAVVGIIMSGFTLTGLGAFLPTVMQAISGDSLFLLLLFAAAASIVLGMGAPPLLVYGLLAATVAPTIIKFGVNPIAAHMFIFYFGLMSMLTPPVALSSLIAARLAGAGFWQTSIEAIRLAIVAFIVPFFFVYQPALLMQGSYSSIAIAMVTSLLGVVALSGALARYLFVRELGWPEAVILGVGGLLLLYPGRYSDVVGFVLVAPSIAGTLVKIVRRRRRNMLLRSPA